MSEGRLGNVAMVVVCVCAVTVTILAVKKQLFDSRRGAELVADDVTLPNAALLEEAGHRVGPEHAKVTILEFGDWLADRNSVLRSALTV